MARFKIKVIDIAKWITIIVLDLSVFIFLGLLLVDYEDTYNHSKHGDCWDYSNMNLKIKVILFCLYSWQILNVIGLIYIARKVYKIFRR